MANLAREGSQNLKVQKLANDIAKLDFESLLRSVYRYRDENEEILRSPKFSVSDLETFGFFEGDCDDASILVTALTKAMGYPVRLTALQTTNPMEYDHVFPEIQTTQGWIPVDITVPSGTVYLTFTYMSELV